MTYYLRIFIVNLNDLKIIKTWMLKHSKARRKVDSSFAYFIIRTIYLCFQLLSKQTKFGEEMLRTIANKRTFDIIDAIL